MNYINKLKRFRTLTIYILAAELLAVAATAVWTESAAVLSLAPLLVLVFVLEWVAVYHRLSLEISNEFKTCIRKCLKNGDNDRALELIDQFYLARSTNLELPEIEELRKNALRQLVE